MLSKLVHTSGLIISLALITYLGYQFFTLDGYLYLKNFILIQYLQLTFGIIFYIAAMFLAAYTWMMLLVQTRNKKIINVYLKTILWKYLPSNLFHFVGRHIYLKSFISHQKILRSNLLESFFLLLTGVILILIFTTITNLPIPKLGYLNQWQLFLLISFFALFNFLMINKKLFNIKKIILINFNYLFFHLLSSAGFIYLWLVFIDSDIGVFTIIEIFVIYLIGWILGLITIGSPGGIGVREGAYLILFQPIVASEGLLLAFLLLVRISNVLAEFILYLASKNQSFADN